MAVKNPKYLVVDASIAQSAGGKNAIYPIPIRCRNFLQEIYSTGHRIIMTPDIKVEWDKHQSGFTRSWYTNMLKRGYVRLVKKDTIDEDLRKRIFAVVEANAISNVEKDMRLIEAARIADERIASLDDRMRNHFRRAAVTIEELQVIIWVNPTIEDENCIIWLRQSAPADEVRKLGYVDENDA